MIARLIDAGRAAHRVRAIRFLIAGGINTAFGYFIYLLGIVFGARPEVALLIATCVGALWNYVTTARFVFAHRRLDRLPLFVLTYAVIYVLNAFAMRLLLDVGVSAALAQGILLPIVAVFSYFLFRTIVFRSARTQ